MKQACAAALEHGIKATCGLLRPEEISGTEATALTVALREIVEHFQIAWALVADQVAQRTQTTGIGFILELEGRHEHAGRHLERLCPQCANLRLALQLVSDWLFPRDGQCPCCEILSQSSYVHGDGKSLRGATLTRTVRFLSQPGTICHSGTCYESCRRLIRDRLLALGAVERESTKDSDHGRRSDGQKR